MQIKKIRKFWDIGTTMANICKRYQELKGYRKGLLSQVAAWHLLKKIGKKPQLSLPEEDEHYSIDMWGDNNTAIQVKTGGKTYISKVNKVAFPALVYKDGENKRFVDTAKQTKARFVVDLERFKKKTGRDIEGYWLNIGVKDRDDITGEPTEEAVERIKKEFEKMEKE